MCLCDCWLFPLSCSLVHTLSSSFSFLLSISPVKEDAASKRIASGEKRRLLRAVPVYSLHLGQPLFPSPLPPSRAHVPCGGTVSVCLLWNKVSTERASERARARLDICCCPREGFLNGNGVRTDLFASALWLDFAHIIGCFSSLLLAEVVVEEKEEEEEEEEEMSPAHQTSARSSKKSRDGWIETQTNRDARGVTKHRTDSAVCLPGSSEPPRRRSSDYADPLFGIAQRSEYFASRDHGGAAGNTERILFAFVDQGRANMGLVVTSNNTQWTDPLVEMVERANIAIQPLPPQSGASFSERAIQNACHANHAMTSQRRRSACSSSASSSALSSASSCETADLVGHYVAARQAVFGTVERVFIERQPPHGMRDIEQLLYAALGGAKRVTFISPTTIHAYFRMGARHGWSAYSDRKDRSDTISSRYLTANGSARALLQWANMGSRTHDVSDCILMSIFVNECKRRERAQMYLDRPVDRYLDSSSQRASDAHVSAPQRLDILPSHEPLYDLPA